MNTKSRKGFIQPLRARAGFTLVEIIAAALIITIASAGTFSAYVLARKFSNRFAYKSQATKIAAAVADDLRYKHSYSDFKLGGTYEENDADGDGAPDTGLDYHTADVTSFNTGGTLSGLSAKFLVTKVWFNDVSGTFTETSTDPNGDLDDNRETRHPSDPPYFNKITVTVGWTEPV